jgi:MFS family permease
MYAVPAALPATAPMPAPARSLNPFRVLTRHRNFRIFWLGQTISLIGSWMQSMAQGWLALELSDSALLVGLVAAIGSVPVLLFSLHAGVLVDRVDKLRLVRVAQSLLLVEAVLLWWFTWSGHVTIGWLLALAAFAGLIGAFEIPARQALMVELVGRDDLHEAIALNSSGFNLARIVGPAIGAVVIARAGLAWCFGVNAFSYLFVLVGLFMIRLPPYRPVAHLGSPLEGIVQGMRYIWRTEEIRVLMGVVTVYSILGVPYLTLMPVVARDLLGAGASGYGVLLACVGVGGLAGALFLASAGPRLSRGRMLVVSSFSYAALLVVFAFVRSEQVARGLLLATGFMMILNSALANGIMQSIVPDAFRGRLMSVYSLVVVGLSQAVGAVLAGSIARSVGVDWAIGAGAAIMLGYAVWTFRRHPEVAGL